MDRYRLVVILRGDTAEHVPDRAAVLYSSGVRLLEVALTTPGAVGALADVRRELPPDAKVGAGSVRVPADVDTAADAGADFLVTPTVRPDVLARADERGLPVLAGALTPTEIDQAWRLGAAAVKVFPVSAVGGVDYVRAVRAPLPDVPLVPTGGVRCADVAEYLAAGAVAVAVATSLLGDALAGGDVDALAARAEGFVTAAAGFARH
nr:bifunctional 4-hydroxy-2-oxoglutarate aldolase/2-dehydro-3-deoxy-phosphogluconate aldolase [Amycolatopsis arida]